MTEKTANIRHSNILPVEPAEPGGYGTAVSASFGHAIVMQVRRQRLILAAVIALLPVLLPLATVFLSASEFADDGNDIFIRLIEELHINALGPLLALFFATMLIGEEVEAQTIPYVITRPLPRSAWVLGKFLAYMLVAAVILTVSIVLTFAASTALPGIGFNATDLILLLRYCGIGIIALLTYGAFTMFLGTVSRRPIVIGVVFLYGWQFLANLTPGVIDFLTIRKYTDTLFPVLATVRKEEVAQSMLSSFEKELYDVSPAKAIITLVLIALVFIGLAVAAVRIREYSSARAIGS